MDIIIELQNNPKVLMLVIGILGLIIGSFLNVVIYRLPIMMTKAWEKECAEYVNKKATSSKFKLFNLFVPPSHCPKCESVIPIWGNIPIVSFLLQKGRCLDCGLRISWYYPLVELLSCLASALVASKFGISMQMFAVLLLTWSLIAIIFIDFENQLIPDSINITLVWLGLILNVGGVFTSAEAAIIGAVTAYLSLWLIAKIYQLIQKVEGMGYGDFKLFAVFGAWFGWSQLPLILLLAAIMGGVVAIYLLLAKKANLKTPIAFGPYLAIAGWVVIFCGPSFLKWLPWN